MCRDGERVALRPKCFDVLVHLVGARGRVVSKEELMERVWADVIVNDGTVSRTVTELRAVLGDAFIEVVPRRGYKFTASTAEPRSVPADYALVHDGRDFPLIDGEHLIGRGGDVAVPIYASATSRHHARVVVSGQTITIEDLRSHNGTFVNGVRIAGVTGLHAGDEIRIGSACLIVWSRGGETQSLR